MNDKYFDIKSKITINEKQMLINDGKRVNIKEENADLI